MELSETQLRELTSAIEEKTGTDIQITRENLSGDYNITVPLTKTQVEKLDKLIENGVRLKLSKTQLAAGPSATSNTSSSDVELVVTPAEKEKN